MDEHFICPDCRSEHQNPMDAMLGHLVRCFACEMLAGAYPVPVTVALTCIEPIRIDIHIAA